MRELPNVINEMLEVIPNDYQYLIKALNNVKKDIGFTAPENMLIRWDAVHETLCDFLLNDNDRIDKADCDWKVKCFSIFSTRSCDKIYNALVR